MSLLRGLYFYDDSLFILSSQKKSTKILRISNYCDKRSEYDIDVFAKDKYMKLFTHPYSVLVHDKFLYITSQDVNNVSR